MLFLFLNLIFTHSTAYGLSINVYLKVSSHEKVGHLIDKFHSLAMQKKLYQQFSIEPYIKSHPLHITLYLSDYNEASVEQIVLQVKNIAQSHSPLILESEKFIVNAAGYMMLSVKSNTAIQNLSLITMQHLFHLRNLSAQIPSWASTNMQRQKIFKHYGSPNVLQFYQPHLSILNAAHLNAQEQLKLSQQLQETIEEFLKIESTNQRFNVQEIGIGIADQQGQIIRELASFSLKSLFSLR